MKIKNLKFKIINSEGGYVISVITFFSLIIMLSIAISLSSLTFYRQKITANAVKSTQAYYAAEAGAEDALIRIKKNPQISPETYNLTLNNATTEIIIPATVGGSKEITSKGANSGVIRNVKTVYGIDSFGVGFYYGAQAGAGGLAMGSGSEIMGNVFSGGNISGSGTIDNNAIVSGNGHSISGVRVKGNAMAYSCLSGATIDGSLTYVTTGGQHTCTHGTLTGQSEEISQQPLPIPQSQIDDWKSEASVDVFAGNKTISGTNNNLGPLKITGNLVFNNNATLTLTGTIYVQGNITFGNGAGVRLSSSYGGGGGVLLTDGVVVTGNNNVFSGSGQDGSYLLIISTSSSNSAVTVSNNSTGAVFYTSAGGLVVSNNVSVVEATGYKIIMNNNSTIQYSSGIVNIYFSSGPSGGWEVKSWSEY